MLFPRACVSQSGRRNRREAFLVKPIPRPSPAAVVRRHARRVRRQGRAARSPRRGRGERPAPALFRPHRRRHTPRVLQPRRGVLHLLGHSGEFSILATFGGSSVGGRGGVDNVEHLRAVVYLWLRRRSRARPRFCTDLFRVVGTKGRTLVLKVLARPPIAFVRRSVDVYVLLCCPRLVRHDRWRRTWPSETTRRPSGRS